MHDNLPVYMEVDGVLVRKEGDVRDLSRRFGTVYDCSTGNQYLREFNDDEERAANLAKEKWDEEAPQREKERIFQEDQARIFRDSLKYERRYVAFVDILGWGIAVKGSLSDNERTRELGLALNNLKFVTNFNNQTRNFINQGKLPGDPQVTHFSDSIVISTNTDKDGKDHLIRILDLLSGLLMQHGFLLRGGIEEGFIFHQDSMVFGPAFLEAYDLERCHANHPRIILSHALAKVWGEGDFNPLGQYKTWCLSDEDNYRFFDFLQPFGGNPAFANNADLWKQKLHIARELIVKNLVSYKGDDRIYPKYVWLAKHFNSVRKQNVDHGINPIDFL